MIERPVHIIPLAVLFCLLPSIAPAETVPEYNIQARIDTQARRITATQSVTFTNNTTHPTETIYFHLYGNRAYTAREQAFLTRYASYFNVNPFPKGFERNAMQVTRVRAGGDMLKVAVEGKDQTLLRVDLNGPLAPGQSITIDMEFTAGIPVYYGRYGTIDGVTALARWYPILAVLEATGWEKHPFYPFQRPFHSDAAHYTVDLSVPAGETVIHSGDLKGEQQDGATKTLHIETERPVRDFAAALSPHYKVVTGVKDGVTVKAFYLPGHREAAGAALRSAQDMMTDYTARFGPYPYKTFSIAPVHLGYGGEQASNLIYIDTRVFDLPKALSRYFDFLIAHETGHQWFYGLVGANDFTQMWLEEGTNSYFLLQHLEAKYGVNASVVRLPRWAEVFLPAYTFRRATDARYKIQTRMGLETPIMSKLSSFNEPTSIFSLTYGKGSRVLGMLRSMVGDEAFTRIFARVFKEYSFKNIDINDFIRIAEEESGKDLKVFFQQWLFTTKSFNAGVAGVHGDRISLVREGGIQMPVDVRITHTDGTQETRVWDGVQERDTIQAAKPVKAVVLDPQIKLLDIDRTNNEWPRRVHVTPVPLYLPLHDIPALMPDDAYNLIAGPEISNGLGLKASFQKPYDYNVTAATDYDFSSKIQRTRAGFQINNVLHSQTSFGAEEMVTNDYDNGEEDLVSDKVYLRRELWPAPYSLTDINDHITLYALRNRTPVGGWLQGEAIRNTSYLRRNESIVGTALHFDRSRPRPDRVAGYTLDMLVENSGHWGGATQTFTRASLEGAGFQPVTGQSTLGLRLKYGWGSADDKNLYQLGGADGLRGYNYKTVRGANALLGSVEYRFPLLDHLNLSVADHWVSLNKVRGVAFFDAGNAWYDDIRDTKLRKDAGLGLRFHVTVGSLLQDIIVRLDVAQAIDDDQDPHTWFGINHAF